MGRVKDTEQDERGAGEREFNQDSAPPASVYLRKVQPLITCADYADSPILRITQEQRRIADDYLLPQFTAQPVQIVSRLIRSGFLSREFNEQELFKLAMFKYCPPLEFTDAGREFIRTIREKRYLASMAAASVDAGQADTTGTTKQTLAHELGVTGWRELEIKVLATGIDIRRAGTADDWMRRNWGVLGLNGKRAVYAFLINVAKSKGTFPNPNKDNRRKAVFALNKAFKARFGLNENPFANVRRLGTQSIIGCIMWGGQA